LGRLGIYGWIDNGYDTVDLTHLV